MYDNVLKCNELKRLLNNLKNEEKKSIKYGFPCFQRIVKNKSQLFEKRFYGTRYIWGNEKENKSFVFRDDIDNEPAFLKDFHDKLKHDNYLKVDFNADNFSVNKYLNYGIGFHKDKECNEQPIYIFNASGMYFILYLIYKT